MSERRQLPHDPRDVRKQLQARLPSLLPALGIADRPKGGLVTPRNPTRKDRHPGSFVIWTGGEAAGGWQDYATAEKGDVFDLIIYLQGLARWIDGYFWALEFLGLGRGEIRTSDQAKLDRERAERDQKAAEARAGAEKDAKAAKAKGFWLGCAPLAPGDLAWTYLTQARGLPLGAAKVPPFNALRFHPALEHIDQDGTGEITEWPAMVSAMSHWDGGAIRGLHRTYLAADGMGKAPVPNAKKMMGVASGCAVRISKGAGNLSPEVAGTKGVTCPLIITEGIEDGLTAAIARPGDRVWAAGSLSLMGKLGWPACASGVVLVADNDWDKPQAVAAFETVEAHWRGMAQGRPLKVVRAQVGKDLNDWARGEG